MKLNGLVQRGLRRLWRSLTRLPPLNSALTLLLVAFATAALMATVGFAGGLYHFAPAPLTGMLSRLATALVAPALGEEIVFRGLLIPDRDEAPRPWRPLAVMTAVFVAWHVFEAFVLLPKSRPLFLRADFLGCAAILGLGCGYIRWSSGSLWPAIALHWLVVAAWQNAFGGPALEALR